LIPVYFERKGRELSAVEESEEGGGRENKKRTFSDDEPDVRIVGFSSESGFDSLAVEVEGRVEGKRG